MHLLCDNRIKIQVRKSLAFGQTRGYRDVIEPDQGRLHPEPAISALRVVVLSLLVWIEAPGPSGVCAASAQIQPVALVVVNVKVNQLRFKPIGTGAPIAAQIVNQKTRQVLPQAV